ncbi:MAG TPA: peroxiredoxin [Candidatus Polarisedimenticolia bacterium]|jgi:peroxiredoxin|nr:peroxiredoxin [Candidatus Polarisedimenticolia bacterium]
MARSDDLYSLPAGLPIPVDDGACDHLHGVRWPALALPSTSGGTVSIAGTDADWQVLYFYPRTGQPDRDPPGGLKQWDAIPGSRGCTPQACAYRDHHAELRAVGARVFGISTQDTAYQREAVDRLHLPFPLLSDEQLELARTLRLPTFVVAGQTLIRRLTLVGDRERIERCFYPVFPPDEDAENVLRYLRGRRAGRRNGAPGTA